MKPIKIFYSLALKSSWKEILDDQINKLIKSDLLQNVSQWNIGVNLATNAEEFVDFYSSRGLDLNILYITPENPYEIWVYNTFMNDAKNSTEPYNLLYLHSKGVNGNPFARSWRDYMEYFCIENWRECVSGLGDEYDTCGVDFYGPNDHGNYHYSGNFWWATSDYIKTLDGQTHAAYVQKYGRFSEEQFICSNVNARHKNWHTAHVNFYHNEYPSQNYRT
jgi:hypothetical protein